MLVIQGKITFLHILFAILLLCVIRSHVSASRSRATRNRPRKQLEECKDDSRVHGTCVKLIKELGVQVCHVGINQAKAKLARSCAATCHFCGRPQENCRSSTSIHGCCWDGYTPRGDIYGIKGCPECKDHLISVCSRFKKFCLGKKTENRAFIELHCPLTCGKCTKKRNARVDRQKVTVADWLRI